MALLEPPKRRSMLGSQSSSVHRSAPAFGFGAAGTRFGSGKMYISKDMVSDKYGSSSPGPIYLPKAFDGRVQTAPAPSFGLALRSNALQRSGSGFTPGPGQYPMPSSIDKQFDSQKHSFSQWTFGTSTRDTHAKVFVSQEHAKSASASVYSPGPFAYQQKSSLSSQVDSRKRTSESFGMGSSQRFFNENNSAMERSASPGPGTYELQSSYGRQVTSNKQSYPSPSFSRADRHHVSTTVYMGSKHQGVFLGKNSPGPLADYTLQESVGLQASSRRPNGPKYGFGTSSRFGYMDLASKAMQTPGPGSYSI